MRWIVALVHRSSAALRDDKNTVKVAQCFFPLGFNASVHGFINIYFLPFLCNPALFQFYFISLSYLLWCHTGIYPCYDRCNRLTWVFGSVGTTFLHGVEELHWGLFCLRPSSSSCFSFLFSLLATLFSRESHVARRTSSSLFFWEFPGTRFPIPTHPVNLP